MSLILLSTSGWIEKSLIMDLEVSASLSWLDQSLGNIRLLSMHPRRICKSRQSVAWAGMMACVILVMRLQHSENEWERRERKVKLFTRCLRGLRPMEGENAGANCRCECGIDECDAMRREGDASDQQ